MHIAKTGQSMLKLERRIKMLLMFAGFKKTRRKQTLQAPKNCQALGTK